MKELGRAREEEKEKIKREGATRGRQKGGPRERMAEIAELFGETEMVIEN